MVDSPINFLANRTNFHQKYDNPGNHDTDEPKHYDKLFGSELGDRNLHGRIETIAGVRIAGLGGVFRTKIWNGLTDSQESPQSFMKRMGKAIAGAVDYPCGT